MKPDRIAALREHAFRVTGSGEEGPLIECLDDIERLMEGERAADKEIKRLRATGNACHRLVSHLYDRETELYRHASSDPAPIPAAQAEVALREARRAIAIVMEFTSTEREYLTERSISLEDTPEAAKAEGNSDG